MTVNRLKFLDLLKKVFPVTSIRGSHDQSCGYDCFLFADGHLSAYNNYASMSVSLPESLTDIDYMIVNAKSLKQLFEKMQGEEVVLNYDEGTLRVKCGAMNAKIQCIVFDHNSNLYGIDRMVREHYAVLDNIEWEPLPDNFYDGLNFCFIPNNSSQAAGLFVNKTDMFDQAGSSMTWCKLDSPMNEFFLPHESVKSFLKMEEITRFKEYYTDDKWMYFKAENEYYSIRLLTEFTFRKDGAVKFKDKYLDNSIYANVLLPDGLEAILERALLFLEKDSYGKFTVSIDFNEAGLIVKAKRDRGELEEFIAWEGEVKIKPFKALFNVEHLLFGLRNKMIFGAFGVPDVDMVTFKGGGKLYCFKVSVLNKGSR